MRTAVQHSDPVVQFKGVTKSYGRAVAVQEMDLEIGRGQFVTLLGPSGCGKSTTLRMLGGFEAPSSGRIILDGRDVTDLPPFRRDVNIVFQDYALFPHLSVGRNIGFGLDMKGMRRDAIAARVAELLRLVHLEGYETRLPSELSGGQRQRVALMRALAPDPQVLLLDEPLSALDAKLRHQMQIELKSIQAETGKTFLFVTHDQDEALTMSDVIVVMSQGRIEQMGSPEDLYHRPVNRFVANFIGDANFLDARVTGRDTGTGAVRLEWLGVPVGAMALRDMPEVGATRTVVVRPESLFVTSDQPAGRPAAPGHITRRIFRGNKTELTLATPKGGEITALMDPNALANLRGDDVWFGWNTRNAVLIAD